MTEFGDYLRGLATLRIATAQAMYYQALARQEYVEVRAYEMFVAKLQDDLRALDRQIYQARKLQNDIATYAKSLNNLIKGLINGETARAVHFFVKLLDEATLVELLDLKIAALDKGDFVQTTLVRTLYDKATKTMVKETLEVEPFAGGNVLDLVRWMQRYPIEVRSATPSYDVLVSLRTLQVRSPCARIWRFGKRARSLLRDYLGTAIMVRNQWLTDTFPRNHLVMVTTTKRAVLEMMIST